VIDGRGGEVKLKAVIHQADEGGLWAEIPEIPGCCAQGLTCEELRENLREAAEGCLLCGCGEGHTGGASAEDSGGETVEIVE